MSFEISNTNKELIVSFAGSYDLSESNSFKQQFEVAMSSEVSSVRLIASDLNYIDSSGVASLLFVRKLASRFNSNFTFESVSEGVARVINLAGLGSVLCLPTTVKNTNSSLNVGGKSLEFSDSDALAIFKDELPTHEVGRNIKNTQLDIKAGTFS